MKIFLAAIFAAALLLTGCGGEQVADKPANNFSGESVKLGMITRLNTDEKNMGDVLDKAAENLGVKDTKHLPKFYENFSQMQMGLEAGEVESTLSFGLPCPKASNFPRLTSKIALLISNSRTANNFLGGII